MHMVPVFIRSTGILINIATQGPNFSVSNTEFEGGGDGHGNGEGTFLVK